MEIEIDSENESLLKRKISTLVKPRGLTGQKKLRNILACLKKVKKRTKKEIFLKNLPDPKHLLFFHVLSTVFSRF